MENQPLPTDASPTALSPDYVVDSDPKKDEKDHKEDPADYPADRGNNDEDESSNDDDDDDDVEKDEEDKEKEEHLAPADPSDVSTDYLIMVIVVAEMAVVVGWWSAGVVAGIWPECAAFKDVAEMKEPCDLKKVKGYRLSYKKEHTKAVNDLATATFPFLSKVVADPAASIKALLSKKPPTLQRPTPSRTQACDIRGLLAGIHGLFSGRYCGLVRRVTYGYPWPGLGEATETLGTVFATGRRSFSEPGTGLRMKRTNRRTRVPIGLYPFHIEEKMTINEVRGESIMEWKTKVTTKEGIVIKFP
nr:hypothetical protein [Tanacetum cinerariifolium]